MKRAFCTGQNLIADCRLVVCVPSPLIIKHHWSSHNEFQGQRSGSKGGDVHFTTHLLCSNCKPSDVLYHFNVSRVTCDMGGLTQCDTSSGRDDYRALQHAPQLCHFLTVCICVDDYPYSSITLFVYMHKMCKSPPQYWIIKG